MLNTKEIYDLMAAFEKSKVSYGRYDKEDKSLWKKQTYYQNGEVNNMFVAFMYGYAFAKSVLQAEAD